jgi:hypothetical protein
VNGLTLELYLQCRRVLLQCDEFKSDELLRAVFVTSELQGFRTGLPSSTSISGRVDQCIDYLQRKRLTNGQPALMSFMALLCDRQDSGDSLKDQLTEAYNALQAAYRNDATTQTPRIPIQENKGSTTSIGVLHNNEGVVVTGGKVIFHLGETSPTVTAKDADSSSLNVFVSYSHQDEKIRDELGKHLKILERTGAITSWHDRQIEVGTEWNAQIHQRLDSAQIILLLISPDFMASDYCNLELKWAMERHEQGNVRVVPIILRPVHWKPAQFEKLQILPQDGKPITTWANQDEAFLNIVKAIDDMIERMR